MKAILEFDLPEEEQEFRWAVNAVGYVCVIQGVLFTLKHHPDATIPVEQMRETIWKSLQDRNLEV